MTHVRWTIVLLSGLLCLQLPVVAAYERTVNPAKPTQLEGELRAIAGLAQRGIQVYRQGTGALVVIDPSVNPLTPQQVAAVNGVLDAHVPDFSEENRRQAFEMERETNPFCTAELDDLNTRVDALLDPVTTLAEVKAAMKIALKRISRCVRARARE